MKTRSPAPRRCTIEVLSVRSVPPRAVASALSSTLFLRTGAPLDLTVDRGYPWICLEPIFTFGRGAVLDLHRGRPDCSRMTPVSDSSRRQPVRPHAHLLKGLRCRRPWGTAGRAQLSRASSSVATRAQITGCSMANDPLGAENPLSKGFSGVKKTTAERLLRLNTLTRTP